MILDYFKKNRPNGQGSINKVLTKSLPKMKLAGLFVLALALILSSMPIGLAADSGNSEPIHIGFTSDVHGNTGNLTTWLTNLKGSGVDKLDYMIFGGDYPDRANEASSWTMAQNCVAEVEKAFGNGTPCVLVRGNHDYSVTGNVKFDEGLVYECNYYAIYALKSASSTGNWAFSQGNEPGDIGHLDKELDKIPSYKPVFVVSHCPIHYYNNRVTGNANLLLSVLNKYKNVIFLWGHNHTISDPFYGKFIGGYFDADKIKIEKDGVEQKLNFTYLSHGGMLEGAYQDIYGLLATLIRTESRTKIDFAFRNLTGEKSNEVIFIEQSNVEKYQLTDSLVAGESYVIVAETGGKNYALKNAVANTNYLAGTVVTVENDEIEESEVTPSMLWKAEDTPKYMHLRNGEGYLKRLSGSEGKLSASNDIPGDGYGNWQYNNNKLYTVSTSSQGEGSEFVLNYKIGSSNYFLAEYKGSGIVKLYKEVKGTPGEISDVSVTITSPVAGAAPNNTAVAGSASYNASGVSWSPTIGGTFDPNVVYTASVTLTAANGYAFNPSVNAKINGKDANAVLNTNGTLTVSYTFPVTSLPSETVYQLTNSLVAGETYVIVAETGGKNYALKNAVANTNYLAGTVVTVENDEIEESEVTPSMLWKAEDTPKYMHLRNGEGYLKRLSGSEGKLSASNDIPGDGYGNWQYNNNKLYTVSTSSQGEGSEFVLNYKIGSSNYFLAEYKGSGIVKLYKLNQEELKSFTLTLDGENITSLPSAGKINEGTEVTITVSPAGGKQVATFTVEGIDKKAELEENKYSFIITADTTVAVTYEDIPVTYTVTFNSNGGSSVDPIIGLLKGETITLPENPTKENFIFGGWFSDNIAFENEFTSTTPVNADIIVYAKWEPVPEIDKEIESVEIIADISVPYGTELEDVELPSNVKVILDDDTVVFLNVYWDDETSGYDGNTAGIYEFEGEIKLTDGIANTANHMAKVKVIVEEEEVIDKDIIYVAAIKDIKVPFGTADVSLPQTVEVTLEDSTTRNLSVNWDTGKPEYDGNISGSYEFEGELVLINGVKNSEELKAGVKVIVEEEPQIEEYTITFDSAGGSAIDSIKAAVGSPLNAPPNPAKTGYTFNGWNPSFPANMPASNITLTAIWVKKEESGSSSSGGSGSGGAVIRVIGLNITKQPLKTSYTEGEAFEPDGMEVTVKYSDKTTKVIKGYKYAPAGPLSVNDTKIIVAYSDKTAEVDIIVKPSKGKIFIDISYTGFVDVPEGSWYFEPIKFVVTKGLYKGISENFFGPNQTLTRGMFVTILSRFEFGEDDEASTRESVFIDLKHDWYKNAVAWAYNNKITLGVSDIRFNPDGTLTREQMIVLIYRYAKDKGYDISFDIDALNAYSDSNTVSDFAKEAMAWALKHGLIDETAESVLAPKQYTTRAESAAVFMKFFNFINKN